MGETFGYHPPEAEKPSPLNNENRFERVEQDKSPEVKKDSKYEPTEQDAQMPSETDAQRRLKKMGIVGQSAMQGDDDVSVAPPPAADERQENQPAITQPGDWSLPPNVSPSEIKVYPRSDGKTQIIYGDERDDSGQIIGDHGHTVINQDGDIDYARTQNGTVKKDTGG